MSDYDRLVAEESLIFAVTEEICAVMDANEVARADLAELAGVSRSQITQTLSGERNMTLRTAAALAFVLGYEIIPELRPVEKEEK